MKKRLFSKIGLVATFLFVLFSVTSCVVVTPKAHHDNGKHKGWHKKEHYNHGNHKSKGKYKKHK